MKSDELMIDIVAEFGHDNPESAKALRKALKAFRTQIKLEVLRKVTNCLSLIKLLYK